MIIPVTIEPTLITGVNNLTLVPGIPVIISNMLPCPLHYDACEIHTREEHKVYSGEYIHVITMEDPKRIIISQQYARWIRTGKGNIPEKDLFN